MRYSGPAMGGWTSFDTYRANVASKILRDALLLRREPTEQASE